MTKCDTCKYFTTMDCVWHKYEFEGTVWNCKLHTPKQEQEEKGYSECAFYKHLDICLKCGAVYCGKHWIEEHVKHCEGLKGADDV